MTHLLPRWRRSLVHGISRLHPGGRFGYVISELANTVTAFEYDDTWGSLKPDPDDFDTAREL